MNGVIIVGHGSRRKEVNTVFKEFVEKLNKENRSEVVEAYFSFHEMTLNRRIEDFFSRGIKTVTIIPYFLFGGRHIDEDIPKIIEKLKKSMLKLI